MLVFTGCAGPLSTLAPDGPAADSIATLWWVMLAGAVLIFGLTMGLFTLAFRTRDASAASTRVWIKGLGIAFPTVVLIALLFYGLVVGERLQAVPTADVVVEATSRQWAWRFEHVRADGQRLGSNGVMHVPAGRPVDVVVRSEDVIHSFWVPVLAGKIDAIPGKTNRMRLLTRRPGRYGGVCAEFCGTGHTGHDFIVIAHDAASWAALAGPGR
ncbi:cytochrome c oxidase subunit II [Polymorphobacter sp.]|uniref:cytochrome c oxidase subunit II n=1 Tax=Polymorphobacter sp. TaxID=1909290 RepID=UPI003F72270E